MQVLTLNELMRLTRTELCGLAARITNDLPEFPEGSPERANALRQPAQHPPRPGAARLLAVAAAKPLPVCAGRGSAASEQRKLVRRGPHARLRERRSASASSRAKSCGLFAAFTSSIEAKWLR